MIESGSSIQTLIGRFERKVRKRPFDCWLWTGSKNRQGYGQFWCGGRNTKAHRVSYELYVAKIPEGFVVMHVCDNPSCVRPAHLRAVRQADNVMDCVAKGRFSSIQKNMGETPPNLRVTTKDLAKMKTMRARGMTFREIALVTGFSAMTVLRTVRGDYKWLNQGQASKLS